MANRLPTDSCNRQQPLFAAVSRSMQLMVAIGKNEVAERIRKTCDFRRIPARGRPAALAQILKRNGLLISGEAIRKWLTGESIPSMDSLRVLAVALDVDPDFLLTGRRQSASVAMTRAVSAAQQQLLDATADWPDTDVIAVVKMLEVTMRHGQTPEPSSTVGLVPTTALPRPQKKTPPREENTK